MFLRPLRDGRNGVFTGGDSELSSPRGKQNLSLLAFSANHLSRSVASLRVDEARGPYKSEVGHTTAQELKPPSCKLKNSESSKALSNKTPERP